MSGEHVRLTARTRVQKSVTGGTSLFPVMTIVRLVDEVRNVAIMKKVRRQSAELRIPLARRMVWCVTDERILILELLVSRRRVTFLGDLPRERIQWAKLPYVSEGQWRLIRMQLTDGVTAQLLIDGTSAEEFCRLLTPAATSPESASGD